MFGARSVERSAIGNLNIQAWGGLGQPPGEKCYIRPWNGREREEGHGRSPVQVFGPGR